MSLAALIPPAWRSTLKAENFDALEAFIATERQHANIFPPDEQIFAALNPITPDEVKVVVIGQDPYPTKGNANGLAFSVSPGVKVPASLKNIFTALHEDLGLPIPKSGDLTPWSSEGVLLLNTVLTVREGEANSHRKKGWEALTTALLRDINARPNPVVFFCLGVPAQKMANELVDTSRHHILNLPHPSPLNGKAFVIEAAKMKPFTRINTLLTEAGRTPIDWNLER